MVKLKQKQAICAWPKLSSLNDSTSFFLIEFFPARTTFWGGEGGWQVSGKRSFLSFGLKSAYFGNLMHQEFNPVYYSAK